MLKKDREQLYNDLICTINDLNIRACDEHQTAFNHAEHVNMELKRVLQNIIWNLINNITDGQETSEEVDRILLEK